MNEEVIKAGNAIVNDTLSPTERDFIDIIPEKYKLRCFAAYKDYRKLGQFGSVFERSKMCTAFMTGIVTAVFLVRDIDIDEQNQSATGAQ